MRLFVLIVTVAVAAGAQSLPPRSSDNDRGPGQTPQASSKAPGESSSRDTLIDLSPPEETKEQRRNRGPVNLDDDVNEFKPYNPHKALKSIEVGEFYLKRKNYPAALARFEEALQYKPRDAVATFRLGETYESMGRVEEARKHYDAYLNMLPNGLLAKEAKKALARLSRSADARER